MKRKITKFFKNLLVPALIAVTLISLTGAAHAALSISYSVSGDTSSSIAYDPSGEVPLYGNNLTVTSVTGNDTILNPGITLPITDGLLNFQTGALTGQTGNVWNFGSAGTVSLQGGISALGLPASTTLLSGSFQSASVTVLPLGSYQFDIVGASFGGTENQNIYNFFGIPADSTYASALNLSFIGTPNAGGGFISSNNFGGVVVDTQTPTPIPAAAWLFGSGLFGLIGIKRKMHS